ncbi:hypothetical protein SAICODRAFT_30836 [Saitoella complicata NRRL Y-17804]|nr:uncharacterized protein SAICODRAFT_30836 [Saitoella complicata NRRL Y-17804]ODQ52418.1 hypothetical protein SAICODRAFT_30836 [Saitoella complicata NRRL Y-17804]
MVLVWSTSCQPFLDIDASATFSHLAPPLHELMTQKTYSDYHDEIAKSSRLQFLHTHLDHVNRPTNNSLRPQPYTYSQTQKSCESRAKLNAPPHIRRQREITKRVQTPWPRSLRSRFQSGQL